MSRARFGIWCLAACRVHAWYGCVPSPTQELLELKREIKDGMYSPLAYLVGNTILQVWLTIRSYSLHVCLEVVVNPTTSQAAGSFL